MRIDREDREVGPEMKAEGWIGIGNGLLWIHVPSNRAISVSNYAWKNTSGIVAWPEPPSDPSTGGWVVSCRVHDELGNPTREGTNFWIQSFGEAVRRARLLRASIMAEHRAPATCTQLTLDDALPSPLAGDPTEGT